MQMKQLTLLRRFLLLLVVCWCLIVEIDGWFSEGHMLIASIASGSTTPSLTFQKINAFVSSVAPFFPGSPDLLGAATWADDVKTDNVHIFDSWHFYNAIYNPTNMSGLLPPSPVGNVLWALNEAVSTLNGTKTSIWGKATMFRFLIHFVGDVHQPLHTIQLFDHRFVNGDAGGSKFLIRFNDTTLWLHSFWDSAGTKFQTSYSEPLTMEEIAILHLKAQELCDLWPRDYFGNNLIENMNFTQWQEESFQLAIKYAYLNHTLSYNESLSTKYIEDTQTISSRQIVLAGYRLGELLKHLSVLQSDDDFTLCETSNIYDSSFRSFLVLTCVGGFLVGIFLTILAYQCKRKKNDEFKPLLIH